MDRAVSKHLFNHHLEGVMDPEAEAIENMTMQAFTSNPQLMELFMQFNSDDVTVDPAVAAQMLRISLPHLGQQLSAGFAEDIEKCAHTKLTVPIRDENNEEVSVLVHTPKSLIGETPNAAIIYAHGGGCVAGSAEMARGAMSHLAINAEVVIFNVDYRLAPETKCPYNVLDFYCTLKYIIENAKDLGIDESRIAIAGESGGGYICLATMVKLAQKDEGHLVKLAIPIVAMTDDYCFGNRSTMTKEERMAAPGLQKFWRCIAKDMDEQMEDPLLFPGKASDDLLRKMPRTIIWEHEFNTLLTETTRFARRLRNNGRLLEVRIQPGMTHMSWQMPGTKGCKENVADFTRAIKEYLLSD